MGLFDSLFGSGTKGLNRNAAVADQRLTAGRDAALAALGQGRGDINAGYDAALGYYDRAAPGLRSDLLAGFNDADAALNSGYGKATGAVTAARDTANDRLNPYYKSGLGAQNLYDTALGTGAGGAAAAKDFYANYASNDPFRAFRDEQAQRELERRYNAGGSFVGGGAGGGGSGRFATASARASLERGTQDLNNYLDRLERAAGRGQQVAGQQGANDMSAGAQLSGLYQGQGTALASNAANRGSALSNLGYNLAGAQAGLAAGRGAALAGNQGTMANLQYGYGQQQAANEISLGNALRTARMQPAQNLISLAGLGVQAMNPLKGLAGLFGR